jgi:phosphoadenosine phosphosulfate reductase
VFPEERLLLEILTAKPFEYRDKSVWATDNRYYIDGTPNVVTKNYYKKYSGEYVLEKLNEHKDSNDYAFFNDSMARFIKANQNRLNYLFDEAVSFIQQYAKDYTHEQIVVSFSGGKDSTVVADLVIRALNNASVVHIFGDTTLEFPLSVCPACH